ncbi:multidrug resistance protein [Moniliophthora roreri]|nr:multidrug resistance protein [Moniliophthora roreri]
MNIGELLIFFESGLRYACCEGLDIGVFLLPLPLENVMYPKGSWSTPNSSRLVIDTSRKGA